MWLERALAALEDWGDRPGWSGLDEVGELAWAWSGRRALGRAGAWQRWLSARGVTPGDRVAIDLPRGPDLLPAHLAVLASGACALPLNASLAAVERRRVLERAAPRVLLDAAADPGADAPVELRASDPSRPALLLFTSGTTGEPKGVPLTSAQLSANLGDLAGAWELSPGDRLLHVLPAHHVHGLALALYGAVRAGAQLVMLPRFEAGACLRALARHRITLLMAVPTMYHRMVASASWPELPDLRLCVSGSAPLSKADFRAVCERLGEPPLERYGLSETLILTSNPLRGERRAGSVGCELPRVELRLAADGEIEARGAAVFPGYWEDEAATAAAFRDGFFRTGDLGERDEDGYLRIRGRKKELILVGGSNVLPGEVEAALEGDAGVDDLAAVGLPDADRGEIVALFAALRAGCDPAAVEQRLRERAEERLASYKCPRRFVFLDRLPRNAMGKVDRRALALPLVSGDNLSVGPWSPL